MTEILQRLQNIFSETYTQQEVNQWPLIAPFVTPLENLSETLKDLSVIAYYPPQKMSDSLGLPFFDCLSILTMVLFVSLSFIFSQIRGPTNRRIFSSLFGMFCGFYYYGVSYWVNLAMISLVILCFSIKMPSRRYNSYFATLTAVMFIIVRAVYE